MKPEVTQASLKASYDAGGDVCPGCGVDGDDAVKCVGTYDRWDGFFTRSMECRACGLTWVKFYSLGAVIVDAPGSGPETMTVCCPEALQPAILKALVGGLSRWPGPNRTPT